MIRSLKDVAADAVKAYPVTDRKKWVLDWPGQIVIAASSIYWTEEVTEAITNGTLKVIMTTCACDKLLLFTIVLCLYN